jgi:diguanylate cyclase (GGDEF)-like protein/PAS domain S-box-containing protein
MSQRILLLIQDDPVDAKLVREALHNSIDGSYKVEWIRGCAEGLGRLAREGSNRGDRIAAILVDLILADSHGIETFDKVFQAAPQIPILVLTCSQDEDIAKSAVQRGAQDYLLKDRLDNYLLPKAIHSMIERAANAEALFEEKERAQVTLNSIGDAVMSTDVWGQVTYLNAVAEKLTGWLCAEAAGHPLEEVFRIVDATSRKTLDHPMMLAVLKNKTLGLPPNCVLIRRDGQEATIEDSAAPIHDRRGRVTGAVMVFHDVSAAQALSLRMSYLAQHDSLTDLPNRILLNDRLAQFMALARRHNQKLGLLYLDVDRFKNVNDSLGHSVGDLLLQAVAARLLTCVRSSDTVSRQGGDEFVLLLSEMTHAKDAVIVAEKVLLALSNPYNIEQHEMHLTASIGIVMYPDDGTEAETLMKNADVAMYHAKAAGRNNYQFFKAEMNFHAAERQSLETGLRHALAREEFVLYYQPKVNLETGAIIGAEALIRWRHPERGLVPPEQFIPVAEECGFVVPMGRWVLREACRQTRLWQSRGLPALRIAVNISAVELRAKDFVAQVRLILAQTGLQPSDLELELTETFLMQDSNSTAAVLNELKALGVHLALDDFGTGYSSLSYVKRFPIDTLKIDRSFVRDIAIDADDASIVSAVIGMGKSLHMRVVAEGVETTEQLEFLQKQGCPFGQGYLFSPPVVARQFTQIFGGRIQSITENSGGNLHQSSVSAA